MNARVTIGTPKTDKRDEVLKLMRDTALPMMKKMKGFKGLLVLTNDDTGKGISITLWNTKADMTAAASDANAREQMGKVASLFTGPLSIEEYEVRLQK